MIKLNETTVNDLLYQLKEIFAIDYENDLVSIDIYLGRQSEQFKLGRFVTKGLIGEYLLGNIVKGFKYEKTSSVHEITVIINR